MAAFGEVIFYITAQADHADTVEVSIVYRYFCAIMSVFISALP